MSVVRSGPSTLVGLVSGAVFAVGLALSGMTDPGKVLGFLDVAGRWDPTLAFVMGGAVGAHFTWLRWFASRAVTASAFASEPPPPRGVDARLIAGAAIFGVGWGMAGYCPGPALVASGYGRTEALLFTAAMLGGIGVYAAFRRRAGSPLSVRESV